METDVAPHEIVIKKNEGKIIHKHNEYPHFEGEWVKCKIDGKELYDLKNIVFSDHVQMEDLDLTTAILNDCSKYFQMWMNEKVPTLNLV